MNGSSNARRAPKLELEHSVGAAQVQIDSALVHGAVGAGGLDAAEHLP